MVKSSYLLIPSGGSRIEYSMSFQRSRFVFGLVLLCFLSAGQPSFAQTSAAAQAPQRKTSTPYTGDLSIFETPGRDQRLHINQVMDDLAITPGKTVADIGAGSGWFTVLAAKRVTATGTVYAVDINPEATQYIEQRATKEQLHNVKTILSKPDDPEPAAQQRRFGASAQDLPRGGEPGGATAKSSSRPCDRARVLASSTERETGKTTA